MIDSRQRAITLGQAMNQAQRAMSTPLEATNPNWVYADAEEEYKALVALFFKWNTDLQEELLK